MCSVKIFDYKLNVDLNKKVFNLELKIAKEWLSRIIKGKLFYSLGALYTIHYYLNNIKIGLCGTPLEILVVSEL